MSPRGGPFSSSRTGFRPCGRRIASSRSSVAVWSRTAPMMRWSRPAAAMHRCIACRQEFMKSAEPDTPAKPTRRVIPFRRAHARRGEELAFLPAALEIVETPPSPIGRAIGATIILLFCAGLVWAWWGTIDIVASASGKIVPSGSTKGIQPRVDSRKTLMEKELGSKLTYFETLQLLVEQQEELSVQKSHLLAAEAAVAAIRETRGQTVAEYRRTLSDELAKTEQKANGLTQDLIKAEQKTRLQQLAAPVDGVVQQLAIHTVGGVATPEQSLLLVVPSDSRLEIEAMVSNRDIGFVHTGQDAEIKIDTFNFTRYGLLHGQVLSVSQDAVIRDRQQDRPNGRGLGTQNDSSEPKGQELNYSARISLYRTAMQIDNRTVNLSPGMAVTVEIKTRDRLDLS